MTKQLYNIGLAEGIQPDEQGRLAVRLAETGVLDQSTVSVDQTTAQASDITLEGRIRSPPYRQPRQVADELRSLGGSALGAVPLFRPGDPYPDTGYYEVESADVSPIRPVKRDTAEYTVVLKRAGTRKSDLRAVAVAKETRSHPFGSTSAADIALPASAESSARWHDPDTGATSRVGTTIDETTAQGAVIDIPLTGRPSGDYSRLVYDVPYVDDPVGVRAFDSRGNPDKFDAEGVRQWGTIYQPQHDVEGNAIILSNGRVRLRVTEADSPNAGAIEYAEYVGLWSSWTDITPSDYDPVDLDITDIDQQRVDAQILFRDLSTTTDDYAVDVTLTHAMNLPLFVAAENESSSIPSDIQGALDPAARNSQTDTRATRTLVDRAEVRR